MKINGGKARKRKAGYWLELSFAWSPSFIVDFKQESRVNDNRKRARLNSAGICMKSVETNCMDCDLKAKCYFNLIMQF